MPQRILIADNSPDNTSSAHLQAAGYETVHAGCQTEALQLLISSRPDLMLLDPDIAPNANILHAVQATGNAVPVIIISSRTRLADAIEAFRDGAWDYLIKPLPSGDMLINTVRNCLTQTQLRKRVDESQAHLYHLVQNLPVIIFIINRNLEFEFLNQTTARILGYSPQEIQDAPRSFLKRIDQKDRRLFMKNLNTALQQGGDFSTEFRFLHKNGYTIHLQAQSITHARRNVPDRLEGMIQDVTRNVYMEKILLHNEKLSTIRTLTEEVAHEIRNPLVSLGGFARQLANRDPEARETQVILTECSRLERLVQRISAYLEPVEILPRACSLPSSLAFVMQLLGNRIDRKHVIVSMSMDQNMLPVCADQEILHRILLYLFGHAIAAVLPDGQIRITGHNASTTVVTEFLFSPVQGLDFSSERMLMPFDENDNNLAICYKLIKRIDGHLDVVHQQDTARFIVTLPVSSETDIQKENTGNSARA